MSTPEVVIFAALVGITVGLFVGAIADLLRWVF